MKFPGSAGRMVARLTAYARVCVDSGSGKPPGGGLNAIAAVLVAVVLVVSPLGSVAAATSSTTSSPSGMVGIPDANIQADYGSLDVANLSRSYPTAADLEGDTMVSAAASTTTVTATEVNGDFALVVGDRLNHESRRIAIPESAIVDAIGYRPGLAYGAHSSGESWTSRVHWSGNFLVFEIPKFSTNTVTFTGRTTLDGNPATAGTQYAYNLTDTDDIDNFSIDITGTTTSAWSNESGSANPDALAAVDIGGNVDPIGPDGGYTTLNVTGTKRVYTYSKSGTASFKWYIPASDVPNGQLDTFRAEIYSGHSSGSQYYDIYLSNGDNTGNAVTYGTDVCDMTTSYGQGWTYTNCNANWDTSSGNGVTIAGQINDDWSNKIRYPESHSLAPSNAAVAADTGDSESLGTFTMGETKTVSLNATTSTTSLNYTADRGAFDYTWYINERAEPVDPTIEVNGNKTGYTGRLTDGKTVSLTNNSSWIRLENLVNVTIGGPTTGPTPGVVLDYGHDSRDDQAVDYDGETWSERYNVSRTWSSDQSNAQLEIPFAGNVIAIRDVEKRVNGGSWQSVSSDSYTLDGTKLTVALGDVVANDTVDVRAAGSKVDVQNGEIQVSDPTVDGNPLSTDFTVVSQAAGFQIDVTETSSGDRLHYLSTASWTESDDVKLYAGGGQVVRFPNAVDGGTATINTVPLGAIPENDVVVSIDDPGQDLKFSVDPGDVSDDIVEWTYHRTTSGLDYILYSTVEGTPVDRETAQSPVILTSYDGTDTYVIKEDSSLPGGAGAGTAPLSSTGPAVNPYLTMIVSAGLVVGLTVLGRRRGLPVTAVAPAGLLIGLVALESLTPGSVTGGLGDAIASIGDGLGDATPAIALILTLVVAYGLINWFRGPDIVVRGRK